MNLLSDWERRLYESPRRPRTIKRYIDALRAYVTRGRVQAGLLPALRAVEPLPDVVRADLPRLQRLAREAKQRAEVRALRRPPEIPDVRRVLHLAARFPDSLFPAVHLAAYAGLRRGDIVRLTWGDVRSDHILLADPKGGRPYSVPLAVPLRDCLAAEYERRGRPAPSEPVVRSPQTHAPLSDSALSRLFREHLGTHPHALRRYFATHLLGRNVPVAIVARLMNHRNIQTTYRYLTVSPTQLRDTLVKAFQE